MNELKEKKAKFVFIEKNEFNKPLEFKEKNKLIELMFYLLISVLAPVVFIHANLSNQLIIGSIVNFALVSGALYFSFKKLIPLIILPGIAAFITGIVFGPASYALIYLIPFIWIGNSLLVLAVKKFKLNEKKNNFIALGAGALGKTFFLSLSAVALFRLNLIPAQFLIAMSAIQLITALIGGTIAVTVHLIRH